MSAISSYTYHVDSNYRTSGTIQAPNFELPRTISLSDPCNYFEAKVVSVEVPYTFYGVNETNNAVFCVTRTYGYYQTLIYNSGTIVIPPSNYTIVTLLEQLQFYTEMILRRGAGDAYTANEHKLLYSYIHDDGTTRFEFTDGPEELITSIQYYFGDNAVSQRLGLMLGFGPSVTSMRFGWVPIFSPPYWQAMPRDELLYIVSPGNVNVAPVTSLFLRSFSLHQHADAQERIASNEWKQSTILLRIPIAVQRGAWIYYDNDTYVATLQQSTISSLDLFITTDSFSSVSFVGIGWRACIIITEMRPHAKCVEDVDNARRSRSREEAVALLQMDRSDLQETLGRQLKRAKISQSPAIDS